jgi:hypothetical protein
MSEYMDLAFYIGLLFAAFASAVVWEEFKRRLKLR